MKNREQYWNMNAIDVVTDLIQHTAGISDAMGRRTPIIEIIGEIGIERWRKVYERLEKIYGTSLWEGVHCASLGELCDRIEAVQAQTGHPVYAV